MAKTLICGGVKDRQVWESNGSPTLFIRFPFIEKMPITTLFETTYSLEVSIKYEEYELRRMIYLSIEGKYKNYYYYFPAHLSPGDRVPTLEELRAVAND